MVTIDRAVFLKIFKHLVGLTAEDPKFELECLYFDLGTEGVCSVAASNGHSLAKLEFSMDYPLAERETYLIHKKWVQGLLTKFKGKGGNVRVYVLNGKLTFTDGDSTQELEGRHGEYPNISLVLQSLEVNGGPAGMYAAGLFKKITALVFDLAPFENGIMAAATQGPKAPLLINVTPIDSVVISAAFAIMPCLE